MKKDKFPHRLEKMACTSLCMALLATTSVMAAGNNGNNGNGGQAMQLDQHEAAELVFMREEEKLARDVYNTLYQRWQLPVFNRIAQSEQRHTDSVKRLLGVYGLVDPVTDDRAGVFADAKLTALYQQLITKGERSLVDALRVGAFIEEIDIQDLQRATRSTDEAMLRRVYANLERGSRNHLRAFVAQIEKQGMTYTAQAMDQAAVDAIVNSPRERGHGGTNGAGHGRGQGKGQKGHGQGRGHGNGRCDD